MTKSQIDGQGKVWEKEPVTLCEEYHLIWKQLHVPN
jgi:hypothetical protein